MLTEEDAAEVRAIVSDLVMTNATVFANASFSDGLVVAFKQSVRVPNWPVAGDAGFYIKPLKAVAVEVEYNTYKDRFRIQLGDPETKEEGVTFNKPFDVDRFLGGMNRWGWTAIQCCHEDIRVAREIERRLPRCRAVTVNEFYKLRTVDDE
jgi:hypothetical protein